MTNINKLTLKELKQYCKDNNIKGYSKKNKSYIINLIENHLDKNSVDKKPNGSSDKPTCCVCYETCKQPLANIIKYCNVCNEYLCDTCVCVIWQKAETPDIIERHYKYQHFIQLDCPNCKSYMYCLEKITFNMKFSWILDDELYDNDLHATFLKNSSGCSMIICDNFIMVNEILPKIYSLNSKDMIKLFEWIGWSSKKRRQVNFIQFKEHCESEGINI